MHQLLVSLWEEHRLQVIRHFEFTPAYGSLRSHKFEALITTYELVLKDAEVHFYNI